MPRYSEIVGGQYAADSLRMCRDHLHYFANVHLQRLGLLDGEYHSEAQHIRDSLESLFENTEYFEALSVLGAALYDPTIEIEADLLGDARIKPHATCSQLLYIRFHLKQIIGHHQPLENIGFKVCQQLEARANGQ